MGKYDITFKEIFFSGIDPPTSFFNYITGGADVVRLLPTNLPAVKESIVDFLGVMSDSTLLHIEVQSTNDPNMHYRMHEYYTLILGKYRDKDIKQVVLYVGNDKMSMSNRLIRDKIVYEYDLVDIRDIDCNILIESPSQGDKLLALLCNIKEEDRFIGNVMEYMLKLEKEKRKDFLLKLFLLSDLRPRINVKLTKAIEEVKMPFKLDVEKEELLKYKEQTFMYQLKEREDVIRLFKKMNLSPEKISDVLEVPLDKVRQYLKEEGLVKE